VLGAAEERPYIRPMDMALIGLIVSGVGGFLPFALLLWILRMPEAEPRRRS
jgi:hypothetical protein